MKKTVLTLVSLILSCMLIVALAGCAGKALKITDIESFSDMTMQTDKIDVQYDDATQEGFNFTITAENEIKEVMEILFSESLSSVDNIDFNMPAPGTQPNIYTAITIYQGEKTYSFEVRLIKTQSGRYCFSTSKLADKIAELATAHGAQ